MTYSAVSGAVVGTQPARYAGAGKVMADGPETAYRAAGHGTGEGGR